MAINPVQLVALQRQTPDFVGQFLQGKQFKQQADAQNRIMDMREQQFAAQQEEQEAARQAALKQAETQYIGRWADMLAEAPEDQRAAIYRQGRLTMEANGVDTDGLPEEYAPELVPEIQRNVRLEGYQPPKRETTLAKPGDTLIDEQTGEKITSISADEDPEDVQPRVDKLRSRYDNFTKDFRGVDAAFRKVKTAPKTAAGDMSLIFGFMKITDPGSTVREGEFATAEAAAGVPTRVRNLYNRALNGERLSEAQRKEFKEAAESLYGAQRASADEQIADLLSQADQDGVARERVLGEKALRDFEKRAADREIQQKKQGESRDRSQAQLMEDASGNKAYVWEDGHVEEVQ